MEEGQFDLYLRIAKNLAFNLPDEKERLRAIKWVKKIATTQESTAKKTKDHVLQLLLICLQRKHLVTPFEKSPRNDRLLNSYNWAYQPVDLAKLILNKEFEIIGRPPISVEVSGDLCEYVAYQEIPGFGAHFYYAYSPEELKYWHIENKEILPKGYLNVTTAKSPDKSILAREIEDGIQERRINREDIVNVNEEDDDPRIMRPFDDVTIMENTGAMKKGFVKEIPCISKVVRTKMLKDNIESGLIRKDELNLDREFLSEGAKITRPHIETVNVRKSKQSILQKTTMKNASEKQKEKLQKSITDMQAENEKNPEHEAMLARMPARLRERLSKKFVPKELRQFPGRDPNLARTPEIFRRNAKGPYRKYKPEEFGLDKNEKFRPAIQVFKDLEYKRPKQTKKSPIRREPMQLQNIHDPTNPPEQDKSPQTKGIEESWEKSYREMMDRRAHRNDARASLSSKRKGIQNRLDLMKAYKPKQLEYDDIDITPEEISFEKFVYKELPSELEEGDVTILGDDEMVMEDMFGDDEIASVSILPPAPLLEKLQEAEILLDTEMEIDDLFAEDQILEPRAVFKEVVVNAEREISLSKDGTPQRGMVKLGKRMFSVPGQEPFIQTYMEEAGDDLFDETLKEIHGYTPPLSESILYKYMDEKLQAIDTKKATPRKSSPKKYGAWAEQFLKDVENIERTDRGEDGESSNVPEGELSQQNLISEEEERSIEQRIVEPSPINFDKSQKQTERYLILQEKYNKMKAQRPLPPSREPIDQDLLDPYIYESYSEDRRGPLDFSIEEYELQKALIEPPLIKKKDPFESFERQMDSGVGYYKSNSIPDDRQQKRIMENQDFHNRRVEGLLADESIMLDDDMDYEDVFGQENIEEPAPVKEIPMPKKSIRRPNKFSHLYNVDPPYRPKMEDILPFERVDEISFPENEIVDDYGEEISEEIPSGLSEVTEESYLESEDIDIVNVVDQQKISSPRNLKGISPTRLLFAQSIQQSIDFADLRRRLRIMKGLPPIENENNTNQFTGIKEDLLDPNIFQEYREELPGIMDDSIVEENLRSPLIKRPPKKDYLASYEKQIMAELQGSNETSRYKGDSILLEDEMDNMFIEECLAVPLPMRQIPMPKMMVGKQIEDLSFLDMESFIEINSENSSYQGERLESIYVKNIVPRRLDFEDSYFNDTPLQQYDFHKGFSNLEPQDDVPAEEDENVSRSQEIVESPARVEQRARNIQGTRDLDALKAKLTNLRNMPLVQASPRNISSPEGIDDVIDEEPFEPIIQNDPFASFEREYDESLRRKTHKTSIISESEMPEMFEEDMIAEPLPIREIPMPIQSTPFQPRKLRFSHLYLVDGPYKPKMEDILPYERLGEISFPDGGSIVDSSFVPSGFERKLEDEIEPDEMASVFNVHSIIGNDSLGLESIQQSVHDVLEQISSFHDSGPQIDDLARIFLARSIKASMEFQNLKEKLRNLREVTNNKLKRLSASPRKCSLVTSFERKLQLTPPQYSIESKEPSILEEDQMEDIFGDEFIAEPPPIQTIPMPSPVKPKPVKFSHLYHVNQPYRPRVEDLLPAGRLDEESFPEIEYIDVDVPPERFSSLESLPPISIQERSPSKEKILPENTFDRLVSQPDNMVQDGWLATSMDELIVEMSDYSSQSEILEEVNQTSIQRTPKSPVDYLQFDDSIGPPPPQVYRDSPIRYREVAPGYYVPNRSIDRQKLQMQTSSRRSPAEYEPNEILEQMTPPQFSLSPQVHSDRRRSPPDSMRKRVQPPEYECNEIFEQMTAPQYSLSPQVHSDRRRSPPDSMRKRVQPPEYECNEILEQMTPPQYSLSSQVHSDRRRSPPDSMRKRVQPPEYECNEILEQMTPPQYSLSPQVHSDRSRRCPPDSVRKRVQINSPPKKTLEEKFYDISSRVPQGRLSIHMDPVERVKKLIAQQPRIVLEPLPRRTGFSPVDYVTKVLPPEEEFLDMEEFPDLPPDDIYDMNLGSLAHALYIPTEQEEIEIEQAQRRQHNITPIHIQTPPQRPPILPDASPIGRTEVYPHEEGFMWLENFVPFEEQVRGQIYQKEPDPPSKRKSNRPKTRRNIEQSKRGGPREMKSKGVRFPTAVISKDELRVAPTKESRNRSTLGKPQSIAANVNIRKRNVGNKETMMQKSVIERTRPPQQVKPSTSRQALELDKRTSTQKMTVVKLGENKVLKQKSSLQIHKDQLKNTNVYTKQNVVDTQNADKIKRKESKFVMKSNRNPPSTRRNQ